MRKHPRSPTLPIIAVLAGALACATACKKTEKDQNDKPLTKPIPGDEPADKPADKPATPPAENTATAPAETSTSNHPGLLDPSKASEKAPETFKARFETTKGNFVIEVTRKWSPNGADRFYNLVSIGYYDGVKFFRVIKNFMVQFGISGDPARNAVWSESNIPDDPVTQTNTRGYVTFAKTSLPNSRSTQIFINYVDRNTFLDPQGFSPFGKVIEGMDVLDKLEDKYGGEPSNAQGQIQSQGNAFLDKAFPGLDHIKRATIVK